MLELSRQNFPKGIRFIHTQEKEVTHASSYKESAANSQK